MTYDLSKIKIKCAEIVGWTGPFGMFGPSGKCAIISLGETLHGTPPEDKGKADNDCHYLPVPNYPESSDAALELVAWMAKPENGKHTWSAGTSNQHGVPCIAFTFRREIMHTDPNVQPFQNLHFTGYADTFQLAVCLAFLKANNIDPETL